MRSNRHRVIIGLTGKAGSGKSTVADYLTTIGFSRKAFATPLKKFALQYFGLTEEQVFYTKPPHARTIMQGIGTLIRRQFDERYFVDEMWQAIRHSESDKIVIDDVRLQNEAEMIREMGGVIVRVVCPDKIETLTAEQQAHESETTDITADYVITANFGDMTSLYRQIEDVLEEMGLELRRTSRGKN